MSPLYVCPPFVGIHNLYVSPLCVCPFFFLSVVPILYNLLTVYVPPVYVPPVCVPTLRVSPLRACPFSIFCIIPVPCISSPPRVSSLRVCPLSFSRVIPVSCSPLTVYVLSPKYVLPPACVFSLCVPPLLFPCNSRSV